jgi:hypothetical protein
MSGRPFCAASRLAAKNAARGWVRARQRRPAQRAARRAGLQASPGAAEDRGAGRPMTWVKRAQLAV